MRRKTLNLLLELFMDPDEPGAEDDEISLISDDEVYNQTLRIREAAEDLGEEIRITFKDVIPNKLYTCEIKFNADAEGNPQSSYYLFRNYELTKKELIS